MRYITCLVAALIIGASALAAPITASKLADKPDAWFTTDEGIATIDNIISWQRPEGGWEKSYDATKPHPAGDAFSVRGEPTTLPIPKADFVGWNASTIDNGATYTEIRLLARAYNLTHRQNSLDAVNRGIDFLFAAQYSNGGWPQRFPVPENYGRDITFNDNAMTAVLVLLRDVAAGTGDFAIIDADRRAKAQSAFDRGVACVLKLQVVAPDGRLTVWAQQYDPVTLQPAPARAFELVGLAAGESAAILKTLMSIKNPSDEVKRAIRAGVAWFEAAKITGKRIDKSNGDVALVDDPSAEPIWARFYEIDTNRPFFCGRDGVKKYSLAEIEKERRTGYAWYRASWGKVVASEYAKWSKANS